MNTNTNTNTNTNSSLISLFQLLCFILFHGSYFTACFASEYSYIEETGRGPSRWAQLNSSWYLCGNGTSQSPIAIYDYMAQLRPDLGNMQTNYKPAQATLFNRGHDIQVEWRGDAGSVTIKGTIYKLLQAHWHTPAEHIINGIRFAMEIHLVHQSSTGKIAVIGAVYRYGLPDPFISKLYTSILALRNGTKSVDLGIVNPRDVFHSDIRTEKYYRYNGSLTTPPCSENVVWTILKKIKSVSFQQVEALKEAVDDGFEENARPIQPLNGRTVYKNHLWNF